MSRYESNSLQLIFFYLGIVGFSDKGNISFPAANQKVPGKLTLLSRIHREPTPLSFCP